MLKIKLAPRGKKHQRTFRVVVAEARSKVNGIFVDDIGFYTPQTKTVNIDSDKLKQWQEKGAQITLGVDKLLNPDKYPNKPKSNKTTKTDTKEDKQESQEGIGEEASLETNSQSENQQ